MKPLGRKNYGSIPHLSSSKLGEGDHYITEGQERILTAKTRDRHDTVLAFEKYDGSNVGIGKMNGKIFALTRSGYEASTSPYKQHHKFADYVIENTKMFDEILGEGERITGEWLYQVHGLKYDIKGEPIVFFDLFTPENKRTPFNQLRELCNYYSLKTPRLLHEGGAIAPVKLLPEWLHGTPNIKSLEMPEGIVYRVERKGKVDFLAKWVRQDFEPGKYCIGVDEKDLIFNC